MRLKGHTLQLKPEEQALFDRVARILQETRWTPPDPAELFPGVDPKLAQRVKIALVESGTVIDLGDGILMHAQAVSEAKKVLLKLLEEKSELAATDFRQALGTTRKYVIPLLNYFDNIGLTQRKGDVRILKGRIQT
uniref:Elongation factor SelB fourth winged-helix domain-containing protein n=1 Tax=candidate division WOR-3 bacterium TaxID=2052148 RepID=A0A7C2APG2_UNCW3